MAYATPREVQQHISGMYYPCSKQDLYDYAIDHGAAQRVLNTIQEMDRDDFASPYDVSLAIREII